MNATLKHMYEWKSIPWEKVERVVSKLQKHTYQRKTGLDYLRPVKIYMVFTHASNFATKSSLVLSTSLPRHSWNVYKRK